MLSHFLRYLKHFPHWLIIFIILTLVQPSSFASWAAPVSEAPLLISPFSEEITTTQNYPPLGIPTFTWRTVQGAVTYQLQINIDPYFTSPNLLEIHTPNLQYTPTGAAIFPDGIYYWRVRVEEPLPGSIFSEPFQFRKSWASALNAPLLIAPADAASLAFFDDPSFSWDAVSGAAKYRFQVAISPDGFGTPLYTQDTSATKYQPHSKFPNGSYYWRVIPLDPAGNPGMPSVIRSFTMAYGSAALNQIPTLLLPTQDSILQFTPTFSWTAISGAQAYRLEYTTGPICDFTNAAIVQTQQTSYTPTVNFPNQTTCCWRVRAESGLSIGDWSETRRFTRQWNLESRLLTPLYADPYVRTPVFSWTPIAGAAYYQIELTALSHMESVESLAYPSNPFWVAQLELPPDQYSWQITPFDSDDHAGAASNVSLFQNPLIPSIPTLVYPRYYYLPNDTGYSGNIPLNPVENHTSAYPVFIWQRVFNPAPYGGLLARSYRIQVSSDPYFSSLVWELDTQNTSATPTLDAEFHPVTGQDYYWRVCPLDLLLPNCQVNPANGDVLWSETWIAQFDPSLSPVSSKANAPQLLRPLHGHEQVEGTPLLEWVPIEDATHYQLQISRDPDFATLEHESYPIVPLYASPVSLAQRNLGRTDYGTFFWRVRGYINGSYTAWSEIRRFQIASQSEWRRIRVLGNERNKLLVGSDSSGDAGTNFDLSTLYISQANLAWYIGFNASNDPIIDMTYVLYIDTDHIDASGGSLPPERPYAISTIPAHQPEYVIFIDQIGGQITAQNTRIFTWSGTEWSYGQSLSALGGSLLFIPGTPGYLELELPDSAIGISQAPDSLSMMVVSVNSSGIVLDSVPSDPDVPGSAAISRFTSVSDRMNQVYPPTAPIDTVSSMPTLVPMYWDWPTGSDSSGDDPAPANPYAGAQLQIALDPQFTILLYDHTYASSANYIGTPTGSAENDLIGDATYYWRVRPRYLNAGIYFGAWSETFSFTREGFTVQNMRTSSENATPEFRWDMVEGAATYHLQLSAQSDFDPLILDISTPNNAYTPLEALAPGTYYWRVGVLREGVSQLAWSTTYPFTLSLPVPAGLTPNNPSQPTLVIPTLCWLPVLTYVDTTPIASAWKYHLQVSTSADFQILTDSTDTEMHCWTHPSWYPQGTYYWRVAIIDGEGHAGGYSATAAFRIQYQATTLISPISGVIFQTPGFIWTEVPGTAYYRLEVALSPDFYPLYASTPTVNIQYTPQTSYPGQVYYWRVAAFNADGYQGAYISAQINIGSPSIWLPMIRK